jgi:hypothetical protein
VSSDQLASARAFSAALRPWVEAACRLEWHPPDGFGPIIIRAALRRQLEALDVIANLTEAKHGYAAVAMLRPSCEELLWLRYLTSLAPEVLQRLSAALIRTGLRKDLEAQAGEVSEEQLREMGLAEQLESFQATRERDVSAMKDLARELGWPDRCTRKGVPPSTWFIADATDSKQLYRFMYHATSRYAHFSPVELARQGWGQAGALEINPGNYEPHWSMFCICWAPRLLAWSVVACSDHILETQDLEPNWEAAQEALDQLAASPLVPIITETELFWES